MGNTFFTLNVTLRASEVQGYSLEHNRSYLHVICIMFPNLPPPLPLPVQELVLQSLPEGIQTWKGNETLLSQPVTIELGKNRSVLRKTVDLSFSSFLSEKKRKWVGCI